ncbi:Response regulator receiver domain protein (CheY) [Trichormus variabilis ATCC 29413]|uniref:Response regulator receiver domain protein (CheY) n=2 Tax=Anabaena variabilis TaxID=264691 RepID=Q3MAF0_TRIV2|nr:MULTISPECIES: response regulator [Nostocaceae]ABA22036.1 Response regulator receiver domain protein (CheY) [Trichormus variabilis ATCC 29413]MBC1213702.1 response regulator [Trichormus variabilis ARAD]MBC1258325.1 response regulator [Trichormus variabilis V5]MBC1266935.1 response regulator [Trichormus variabilis FSR]MBC1303253.1 response regulator [Trichormus variabilis N2B]
MATKRILIIDDEYDIRAVAELAFKAVGGWQVSTAASGSEGVAKAAAEQPDVILLDVMMPDIDGIATFQALQANPVTQSIPVILLTAKTQTAEQRGFAELGVQAIITKPFKVMKLPAQVAAALNW